MDPEKASATRFSKEGDEMIRNEAKKKKKYKGYFCLGIVGPAWDLHSQSQQTLPRVSKLAQDVAQFWFWASLDLGWGEIGWQESPDFSVVCFIPFSSLSCSQNWMANSRSERVVALEGEGQGQLPQCVAGDELTKQILHRSPLASLRLLAARIGKMIICDIGYFFRKSVAKKLEFSTKLHVYCFQYVL